jgi:uncharacterized peroxidase-related enzyme
VPFGYFIKKDNCIMAYIKIKDDLPGIVGLFLNKPSTGKAGCGLAHAVLRGPSSLSIIERELIAAYVSSLNECEFCFNSHGTVVNEIAKDKGNILSCAINDIDTAPVSGKMKALLRIAGKVQKSGKLVTEDDIKDARNEGATDEDIHDTVLVAAAFCLFNRYVDGLNTQPLNKKEDYVQPARGLIKFGYKYPNFLGRYFMKRMFKKLQMQN